MSASYSVSNCKCCSDLGRTHLNALRLDIALLKTKDKPLVLKELRKLWNKEEPGLPWNKGDFSPSNTLLVDDSPYKALRNPVLPSPCFLLPLTPGTKFILCNSHAVFFSCFYIVQPHTAIFPYSYSYKNDKDDSLGKLHQSPL